jgi:ribosomal protein S12 methylthiotransferase accessory factor
MKVKLFKLFNYVKIQKIPRWYDLPFMYQYVCKVKKSSIVGVGSSLIHPKSAIIRALYESIERLSLQSFQKHNFIKKSLNEVKDAINLNDFLADLDKNLSINPHLKSKLATRKDKFSLLKGYDVLNKKYIWIPAQLVYVPQKKFKEKFIRESNSSGASAGLSLNYCLIKSILELLEREAFIIYYLNKHFGEKINLNNISQIKEINNRFLKYKLKLYTFHLPTDFDVFNIITLLIDETGLMPVVSCGASSGFDLSSCIIKSIEESLQVANWIRFVITFKKTNEMNELEKRGLYWTNKEKLKCLYKMINNSDNKNFHLSLLVKRLSKINLRNNKEKLKFLIKQLKSKNFDLYYVNITPKKFKKYNLKIIKAIIPQLQPLYLSEDNKYLVFDRILKVPKKFNFPVVDKYTEINKIPHFFL